jgi:hypothetical protein
VWWSADVHFRHSTGDDNGIHLRPVFRTRLASRAGKLKFLAARSGCDFRLLMFSMRL